LKREAGVIICTRIDGDGRQYCGTSAVDFGGLAASSSGEKRGQREGTTGFKGKGSRERLRCRRSEGDWGEHAGFQKKREAVRGRR
jgi:hypothetical protein